VLNNPEILLSVVIFDVSRDVSADIEEPLLPRILFRAIE
jgi:hypothetical protein